METDAIDQQGLSNDDDFFNDGPPKQNGDLAASVAEEETPVKEKEAPASDNKDGGDSTPAVDEASGETNNTQDPDAVAASGGDGGDGNEPVALQEEDGAEPAAAAKQDDPVDEGFQSTSPPPAPEPPAPQAAEEDQNQAEEPEQQQESPTDTAADQAASDPSEPEADQDKTSVIGDDETTKGEEGQPEAQSEGQGDTPVAADKEEEPEDKPEAEAEADAGKYDNDYEDSFSQCSQKSLASVDSTAKTMNPKIDVAEKEAEKEEEPAMANGDVEHVSRSPTPVQKAASPTPSRDSRAEGIGSVDTPVVVEEPKTDGRSSAEVKENGEYRGEDRTETTVPEGTEDSRGQGQWKSPEDQYIASAVLAHKTEQEALKEVQEERDKLLTDQESMKSSLTLAEEELSKKSDLLVAEKEISASRGKQMQALQDELAKLYAKEGEGSEERIKDLQERLAVLARENEEKEQMIHKLNDELKATNLKLRDTEKQLAVSEQERARQASDAAEAPKSKTCVVM